MNFYKLKNNLNAKQLRFYHTKRIELFSCGFSIAFSVDEALRLALLSR